MPTFRSVLLLADEHMSATPDLASEDRNYLQLASQSGISVEALTAADLTIVYGLLASQPHAVELAGGILAALHAGRTVVVAPGVGVAGAYPSLLSRLGIQTHHAGAPMSVKPEHPAFEGYFRVYGVCAVAYEETLGTTPLGAIEIPPAVQPGIASFVTTELGGALYVVPYHVGSFVGSQIGLTRSLVAAVESHSEAQISTPPGYLADLRLATERELLDAIQGLRGELAELERKAQQLARYRLLVGPLSGDPLEELVIAALNVVLGPTGCLAEDREELFREDFWICSDNGVDVALAEVKGIGSGIRRAHINQVDDHREALGKRPEDVPGLLVVNQHRGTEDLSRKLDEAVHPDVRAHAHRQNVVVLRTADLYRLLDHTLAGREAGADLIAALCEGGGWLHVHDGGSTLLTD